VSMATQCTATPVELRTHVGVRIVATPSDASRETGVPPIYLTVETGCARIHDFLKLAEARQLGESLVALADALEAGDAS
jgi:hypothetical protein